MPKLTKRVLFGFEIVRLNMLASYKLKGISTRIYRVYSELWKTGPIKRISTPCKI